MSEQALQEKRWSSFRTPSDKEWIEIKQKCMEHLGSGRSLATLPHAHKIWMLFGFHLFHFLREGLGAEVIETYPFAFAIVSTLMTTVAHKSTEQGYNDQLAAVAKHTGWKPDELEARTRDRAAFDCGDSVLTSICSGSRGRITGAAAPNASSPRV